MSTPPFDVTAWPREIDAVLAKTENPRHRFMLLNMREHLLLELSGRWREVLVPTLMVAEPSFHLAIPGSRWLIDGMAAVSDFYHNLWDSDPSRSAATCIVPRPEPGHDLAVNDQRVVGVSTMVDQRWGRELAETQHAADVEPDGLYLVSYSLVYVFEYGDGDLLVGENTYSGNDSFLFEIDRRDVVTPEMASAALKPYLDNPPPQYSSPTPRAHESII